MARINWGRLFLGSLIAAIIMFVTDGLIHETILKADWHALYTALRATEPEGHGSNMVYFALFELGRGFTAMMFYATCALSLALDQRPRSGRYCRLDRVLTHWTSAVHSVGIFFQHAVAEGRRDSSHRFDNCNNCRRCVV